MQKVSITSSIHCDFCYYLQRVLPLGKNTLLFELPDKMSGILTQGVIKSWMLWWRFLYKCQCQQRRVAPWRAWLDPLTSREPSVNNFSLQTGASLFMFQFSSVQSLSRVRLFATPWIAARPASLSITNSRSLLKLIPSSQWCHPAISSSAAPFSSCPQSLPASGSFPVN